ncbi:hypothetical protein NBRC110019_02730 [Neptunitalea chrysea]|uniref:Cyclic nucleotide-binding domain-containing protein n=1 Tax=Neptunitalea chrysea TaxID=1647581 RepID=A0A9W6B2T1_9FLAO|nr:hypothetical protein [Neptunitalea chrysea]GLB51234.1 hypothetical protein NBRC110019_02730 [Neptunitalea chrysea]
MEKIKHYLNQIAPINTDDWNLFASKLSYETYPSKTILLNQEEIENHLYFIDEGIIRLYFQGEVDDITFGFGFPNSFISCYDSFLTRQKSSYCMSIYHKG